jgi:hypothetical protein
MRLPLLLAWITLSTQSWCFHQIHITHLQNWPLVFQQLVCETFKKSNETTYVQSFTKIWWAFCMCMFSCILCTSLHEEPLSLSMCASSYKKYPNNIGFDFVGHDDMVINRVQTHSYTNQNTSPNIWVSKLLIFQWW